MKNKHITLYEEQINFLLDVIYEKREELVKNKELKLIDYCNAILHSLYNSK